MSIREEVQASAAAHRDLGPGYDAAVAEGLVERIGEENDRRVDARMFGHVQAPARPDTSSGDQGVPLGRRPAPSHYARAAVFLACDDAEMITGIDLRVDGGVVSRYWRWNPGTKILPAD